MRRRTNILKVDSTLSPILGSDEAGFGNWAGPMIVVAVSAPLGWDDSDVGDSKKLTDAKRRSLKAKYENDPRFTIVPVIVEPEAIDAFGGGYRAILSAHKAAVCRAVEVLGPAVLVVIDGTFPLDRLQLPTALDVVTAPGADARVPEVGLASCIAKTLQIDAMRALDLQYPGYGFAQNCGYGTKQHQEALDRLGPCPAHRRCYAPVKRALAQQGQPMGLWDLEDE